MSNILVWLWLIVLLELVLPVPGLLTIGAIYVLIARPPWFPEVVRSIYGDPSRPQR